MRRQVFAVLLAVTFAVAGVAIGGGPAARAQGTGPDVQPIKLGREIPLSVAVGEGVVFVSDDDALIWWVDAATGEKRKVTVRSSASAGPGKTYKAIPCEDVSCQILRFGEGYLWAGDSRESAVVRILAQFAPADAPDTDGEAMSGPTAIFVEPDTKLPQDPDLLGTTFQVGEGAMWFTGGGRDAVEPEDGDDGASQEGRAPALWRVEPTTGEIAEAWSGDWPSSQPSIAVGDGVLWLNVGQECTKATVGDNGKIEVKETIVNDLLVQFDPASGSPVGQPISPLPAVEGRLPECEEYFGRLYVVGQGALWGWNKSGLIRVDVATGEVDYDFDETDPVLDRARIQAVAVGQGSIWVLSPSAIGDDRGPALLGVDPTSGEVLTQVPLQGFETFVTGEEPMSLAVGNDAAWVIGIKGQKKVPTLWRVDLGPS